MKLINKLKKTYPRLKKGLNKKYDDAVIGVTADELKLVYSRKLLIEKMMDLKILDTNSIAEYEEYVYWNISCATDCVIVNLSKGE